MTSTHIGFPIETVLVFVGLSVGAILIDLFAHKDEIEKNMEMELEWKELPERKASRILIEKTVDLDDRATWPEQFDYIMDTCIKMKRAFKRYL